MSNPTRNVVESTTNSATERLRALLDERGVEWRGGLPTETIVKEPIDTLYVECPDGRMHVYFSSYMTPEQAVAATLGPGTCRDVRSEDDTIAFECSECGCWVAYDEYWETGIYIQGEGQQVHIHPRYCPNCGRTVVG